MIYHVRVTDEDGRIWVEADIDAPDGVPTEHNLAELLMRVTARLIGQEFEDFRED